MASGGEADATVREMVRSMGAKQLDEAIRFATFELVGRDISFEETFRLCDKQDLRRAKKPDICEVSVSGSSEKVERVRSKLVGEKDGRPSSDSSEEAVVELLRALQTVPMTFETLEATKIGKTINSLRKHSLEQVRTLAAALYKNWKALVDDHLTRSSSKPPGPTKTASALAAADHAKKINTLAAYKPDPAKAPKNTALNKREEVSALVDEAKLAVTKRKLQEGYKEAASAKKRRMIEAPREVIDAPRKMNRRPVAVVER